MKIRGLISLVLALCLLAVWFPATAEATQTILPVLTPDTLTTVTIHENDGFVTYSFTPTRTGFYNLTSYSDADPFVVLLDSSVNEIAYNDDGGDGYNFSLYAMLAAGKTYYFGMAFYDGTGGTFDVLLTCLSEPVIQALEQDTSVSVSVTEEDPIAFYSFTPTLSGRYRFSADSQGGDTLCYLYDSQWNYLDGNDDFGNSYDFFLETDLTAGETYYFGVRLYGSDSGGSFRILLTQAVSSIVPGDLNEDGEVDIFDANLAVGFYNGTVSLTADRQTAADVNGDGEVDIFDANLIVSYYNGTISVFPTE